MSVTPRLLFDKFLFGVCAKTAPETIIELKSRNLYFIICCLVFIVIPLLYKKIDVKFNTQVCQLAGTVLLIYGGHYVLIGELWN